jgi:hypothetical protein
MKTNKSNSQVAKNYELGQGVKQSPDKNIPLSEYVGNLQTPLIMLEYIKTDIIKQKIQETQEKLKIKTLEVLGLHLDKTQQFFIGADIHSQINKIFKEHFGGLVE